MFLGFQTSQHDLGDRGEYEMTLQCHLQYFDEETSL